MIIYPDHDHLLGARLCKHSKHAFPNLDWHGIKPDELMTYHALLAITYDYRNVQKKPPPRTLASGTTASDHLFRLLARGGNRILGLQSD